MWLVRFGKYGGVGAPDGSRHLSVLCPVPEWAARTDREAIAHACGYLRGKGYDFDGRGGNLEERPIAISTAALSAFGVSEFTRRTKQ